MTLTHGCTLLFALLAGSGCAAAPSARVLEGQQHVASADAAMLSGGLVFAPYEALPVLGVELTHEHYRCIDAVNRAVAAALAARYAVRAEPATRRPASGPPAWARSMGGPRVAVHVEGFRCGLVVGDSGYTAVASDDPGGAPPDKLGEAVLGVYDRSTGARVLRIRAEAIEADGFSAVRSAGATAVERLVP